MTKKAPSLSDRIRALVAAHPGQFSLRELVALLPTDPRDKTPRERYRRISGLVNPMLAPRWKDGPQLWRDSEDKLHPRRKPLQQDVENLARRKRARMDRRNAYARAWAARKREAAGNPPRKNARKVPERTIAQRARREQVDHGRARVPPPPITVTAREALPCTETFLRANPHKLEILPTFWGNR